MAGQELGEQNSVITANYSSGIHTIRIVGSTVIPEFTFISIMLSLAIGLVLVARLKKFFR